VDGLVELVKDAEVSGIDLGSQPYSFIESLCSADFVAAFVSYAMNDPHPVLAQMIMVPLRWLRRSDLPRYWSVGIQAATHENYLVAYGAANAVSYGPSLAEPFCGRYRDPASLEPTPFPGGSSSDAHWNSAAWSTRALRARTH
jgi:hypothetical protein